MALQVWLPLNTSEIRNLGVANITFAGTLNIVPGKFDKCAYFAESLDNCIQYTGQEFWYPLDVDFTICFWLKIVSKGSGLKFIMCVGSDNDKGYGIRLESTNTIRFQYCNGFLDMSSIPEGWNHITFIKTGMTVKGYLNGVYKCLLALDNPILYASTNGLAIGKLRDTYYPCDAMMNDFRLYDHAISLKELDLISKGLIVHYPFNQEIDSDNIIYDTSGFNNNLNATFIPTICNESPRYDKCYQFTGNQESLERDLLNIISRSQPFSISVWAKYDDISKASKFIYSISSTTGHVNLGIGSGMQLLNYLFLDNAKINGIAKNLSDLGTNWNHFVTVWDGTILSLYKNSTLLALHSAEINYNSNYWGKLSIGDIPGKISDFRIYTTALSEKFIKELYQTAAFVNK